MIRNTGPGVGVDNSFQEVYEIGAGGGGVCDSFQER